MKFLVSPGSVLLLFMLFFCHFNLLYGQKDSLILSNNDALAGEIKDLQKGVVTLKTPYSDADFKIEWKKVKSVYTESSFLIRTRKGHRFDGRLRSIDSVHTAIIKGKDTVRRLPLNDIVFLRQVKSNFLSKFSGSLSVGYNFTKAENLSEFSLRSRLGYRATHWGISAKYNDIRSTRKNATSVERLDASVNYRYYLKNNWFTVTEISWLSNTEQNIKLRILGKLGVGKFIVQTNRLYWTMQAGAVLNRENFDAPGDENFKNSGEAFVGTELNLYDIKDFSLLTGLMVYPSLTESRRWRLDYNIDLKYDLPLHFFIKLGFTLNYDSQPVSKASSSDYIFQTTVGWDFN